MRKAILAVVSVFLVSFGILTLYAAVDRGFTILSVASILILALLSIGILGALWQQPPDE
ncbi:MAG TPA: hypothetical protein VII98_09830 [Solirubrobacteraceae bacterium]